MTPTNTHIHQYEWGITQTLAFDTIHSHVITITVNRTKQTNPFLCSCLFANAAQAAFESSQPL